MGNKKIIFKALGLSILISLGGMSMTTGAEPTINHRYMVKESPYDGQRFTYVSLISKDNKYIFADLNGMTLGSQRKVNQDFGVYAVPLDKDMIARIKKINGYLRNPKLSSQIEYPSLLSYLSYSLDQASVIKTFAKRNRIRYDLDIWAPKLSKDDFNKLSKAQQMRYEVNSTLSDLLDLQKSPQKKLISTLQTSYSLEPFEKGVRVQVSLENIGVYPIQITSVQDWVKRVYGRDSNLDFNCFEVKLLGLYKGASLTSYIDLKAEYLDFKTREELGPSLLIKIPASTTKTLSFFVPYEEIQFESDDPNNPTTWNAGINRTQEGHILFDHAAMDVYWKLRVTISYFSDYVEHHEDQLIQLRDWKNL
ncbi:hypothetical protein [Acinetobacter gerneri]|uniref:hypothetical protein n=1 Tax=Acinetobacter gerneri TaxID=202952 RepID=UPI0028A5CC89|nr:hypothetical protein [Acinetobacter gerneri]